MRRWPVLGIAILVIALFALTQHGSDEGATLAPSDRTIGERSSFPSGPEELGRDAFAPTEEMSGSTPGIVREREESRVGASDSDFAEIRGTIVDEAGAPVPGARVRLRPIGEFGVVDSIETFSGDAGEFVLKDVVPNRTGDLIAQGVDSIADVYVSLIRPGEILELGSIPLRAAARVIGTVTSESGVPVAGARLFLDEYDEVATSDAVGRFEIPRVAWGAHVLEAKKAGFSHLGGIAFEVGESVRVAEVGIRLVTVEPRLGYVVDPEGTPIAKAKIDAYGRRRGDPSAWLERVESRSDGSFVFQTLGPGELSLSCYAPGRRSKSIEVPADSPIPRIVLDPGFRIEGRAYDSTTKSPVMLEELQVYLASDGPRAERRHYRDPEVALFPDGSFRCVFEPPRSSMELFLWARSLGGSVGRSARFSIPATESDARPPFVTIEFSRPALIEVTVLDEVDDSPIRDARIELYPPELSIGDTYGFYRAAERCVRTFADGRAQLLDVPPGEWRIVARAEGFAPMVEKLTIDGPSERALELRLGRGGTIECVVLDEHGAPAPAIEVFARGTHSFRVERRTDSEGGVRFEHVVPGKYTVHAEQGDEYESAYLVERSPGVDVDEYPVLVEGGATIRLVLRTNRGRRGVLEGRVEVDGVPLAFARIFVHSVEGNDDEPWIDVLEAVTDEEGRYRFPRLLPDTYFVTVVTGDVHEYFGGEATVVSGGMTGHSIAIETASISGVVRDRSSGAPLAGVTVIANAAPESTRFRVLRVTRASVESDDAGRFTLSGLQRGRYELLVRRVGAREQSVPAVLVPGSDVEISVP